jgi:hypothetical protein
MSFPLNSGRNPEAVSFKLSSAISDEGVIDATANIASQRKLRMRIEFLRLLKKRGELGKANMSWIPLQTFGESHQDSERLLV